jgi:hypothetical protein
MTGRVEKSVFITERIYVGVGNISRFEKRAKVILSVSIT